jgi:hypothetical protein
MSPGGPEASSAVLRIEKQIRELWLAGRPELDGLLHDEKGREHGTCGPFFMGSIQPRLRKER